VHLPATEFYLDSDYPPSIGFGRDNLNPNLGAHGKDVEDLAARGTLSDFGIKNENTKSKRLITVYLWLPTTQLWSWSSANFRSQRPGRYNNKKIYARHELSFVLCVEQVPPANAEGEGFDLPERSSKLDTESVVELTNGGGLNSATKKVKRTHGGKLNQPCKRCDDLFGWTVSFLNDFFSLAILSSATTMTPIFSNFPSPSVFPFCLTPTR
jgi:hypothetical protein